MMICPNVLSIMKKSWMWLFLMLPYHACAFNLIIGGQEVNSGIGGNVGGFDNVRFNLEFGLPNGVVAGQSEVESLICRTQDFLAQALYNDFQDTSLNVKATGIKWEFAKDDPRPVKVRFTATVTSNETAVPTPEEIRDSFVGLDMGEYLTNYVQASQCPTVFSQATEAAYEVNLTPEEDGDLAEANCQITCAPTLTPGVPTVAPTKFPTAKPTDTPPPKERFQSDEQLNDQMRPDYTRSPSVSAPKPVSFANPAYLPPVHLTPTIEEVGSSLSSSTSSTSMTGGGGSGSSGGTSGSDSSNGGGSGAGPSSGGGSGAGGSGGSGGSSSGAFDSEGSGAGGTSAGSGDGSSSGGSMTGTSLSSTMGEGGPMASGGSNGSGGGSDGMGSSASGSGSSGFGMGSDSGAVNAEGAGTSPGNGSPSETGGSSAGNGGAAGSGGPNDGSGGGDEGNGGQPGSSASNSGASGFGMGGNSDEGEAGPSSGDNASGSGAGNGGPGGSDSDSSGIGGGGGGGGGEGGDMPPSNPNHSEADSGHSDMILFKLKLGFFEGGKRDGEESEARSVEESEIKSLICYTQDFFSSELQATLGDTQVSFKAIDVDWDYNGKVFELTFAADVKDGSGAAVPEDDVFQSLKVAKNDLHEFMLEYVLKVQPPEGRSETIFFDVNEVDLQTFQNAPIPIGRLPNGIEEPCGQFQGDTGGDGGNGSNSDGSMGDQPQGPVSLSSAQRGMYGLGIDSSQTGMGMSPQEAGIVSPNGNTTASEVLFSVDIGFFKNGARLPKDAEVQALLCEIDKFFEKELEDALPNELIGFELKLVDWTYNGGPDTSVSIEFVLDAFSGQGATVPSAAVYEALKLDNAALEELIQSYIWKTKPNTNLFHNTSQISFAANIGSPMPSPDRISAISCPDEVRDETVVTVHVSFGFLEGNYTEPNMTEIESLICETNIFLEEKIQEHVGDQEIDAHATDIDWTTNESSPTHLTVAFSVKATFGDDTPVNSSEVYQSLKLDEDDIKIYLESFVMEAVSGNESIFLSISELSFEENLGAPLPRGKLEEASCPTQMSQSNGTLPNNSLPENTRIGGFGFPGIPGGVANGGTPSGGLTSAMSPSASSPSAMAPSGMSPSALSTPSAMTPSGIPPSAVAPTVISSHSVSISSSSSALSSSQNSLGRGASNEDASMADEQQAAYNLIFGFYDKLTAEPSMEEIAVLMCEAKRYFTEYLKRSFQDTKVEISITNIQWFYNEDCITPINVMFAIGAKLGDGREVSTEEIYSDVKLGDDEILDLILCYVWQSGSVFSNVNQLIFEQSMGAAVDLPEGTISEVTCSVQEAPAPTPDEDRGACLPLPSQSTTAIEASYQLAFGFYEGKEREPTVSEVESLICQTNSYFELKLQEISGDSCLEAHAIHISWSYTPDCPGPVTITFFLVATFCNGQKVAPESIFGALQLSEEEIKVYLEGYVWHSMPEGSSLFYQANRVGFDGSLREPLQGQIAQALCPTGDGSTPFPVLPSPGGPSSAWPSPTAPPPMPSPSTTDSNANEQSPTGETRRNPFSSNSDETTSDSSNEPAQAPVPTSPTVPASSVNAVLFHLEFGFYSGTLTEPTRSEIEALICESTEFVQAELQSQNQEECIEATFLSKIDWTFDDECPTAPVTVTYAAQAMFCNGTEVPPEIIYESLKLDQDEIKLYLEAYIWHSRPAKENVFFNANGMSIQGKLHATIRPGKIAEVSC